MNRIKELREKKGLQQKELSIDLGVSQPTISDWESGRKQPSSKSAAKIADYFSVSLDYLLGRETETAITPEDVKFALFGGGHGEITDAEYEDVLRYAEFVRERKRREKNDTE
jgi:transcriptional regulator with XRE-family HTH domain